MRRATIAPLIAATLAIVGAGIAGGRTVKFLIVLCD